MGVALRISPCRTLCDWGPTRVEQDGERLFACTGCGSQWVPSEPWTPRQADGAVPDGVRAALSTAPAAGGAGTAGS
ncbi:MAG: hypothetical protein JWO60_673 [Frankiales bacterium]|nr:hypothetical protein [Frankiales bacterium]